MPKGYKNYTVRFFAGKKERYSHIKTAYRIKRIQTDRMEENQAPEDSDAASTPPFKQAAFLLLLSVIFLLCGLDKYNLKETTAGFLCFAFSLIAFLLFLAAVIIGIGSKRKP